MFRSRWNSTMQTKFKNDMAKIDNVRKDREAFKENLASNSLDRHNLSC